jgi:hypothetical protein
MTVVNQNLVDEEIKSRLNLGNACNHSVQNFLSSRLMPKNAKIKYTKEHLSYKSPRLARMFWFSPQYCGICY